MPIPKAIAKDNPAAIDGNIFYIRHLIMPNDLYKVMQRLVQLSYSRHKNAACDVLFWLPP
ncbi:hypothetical protein EZS27_021122 [termite gut metagenome]|uniref:Uncharacterized protein n=1 Tax=termite gut metagenome TaxID=433724 RepID=A0A5J4R952_9ZZZZ